MFASATVLSSISRYLPLSSFISPKRKKMTLLDILLAVPLVWLVVLGWRHGLVREAATLGGVVAGIWASVHLSQWVSSLIGLEGENAILIAFFVTFVGAMVLVYLLGRSLERMLKAAKLGMVNKISGAALGMAKALCVLAVVLNAIVLLDHHEKVVSPKVKSESVLYKPVYSTGNMLLSSLKDFIAEHKDEWPHPQPLSERRGE